MGHMQRHGSGEVCYMLLRYSHRETHLQRTAFSCAIGKLQSMPQNYTTKQMGDACEMLVAAELTLAGVPALKVPDNWPCYDVIAQPTDGRMPQRISVKSRTFRRRGRGHAVSYNINDEFDWLAIVLLPGEGQPHRRIFLVPRGTADKRARHDSATSKNADERGWWLEQVLNELSEFEGNFTLSETGRF
jgi:hypothetical protein